MNLTAEKDIFLRDLTAKIEESKYKKTNRPGANETTFKLPEQSEIDAAWRTTLQYPTPIVPAGIPAKIGKPTNGPDFIWLFSHFGMMLFRCNRKPFPLISLIDTLVLFAKKANPNFSIDDSSMRAIAELIDPEINPAPKWLEQVWYLYDPFRK